MKSVIELETLPVLKLPQGVQRGAPTARAVDRKFFLAALACFLVGLAACLFQNFTRASLENTWVFDSGHYLVSCQQVADAWRSLSHELSMETIKAACLQLKSNLLVDGPILPSLGAIVVIITNKSSAVTDPRDLIILQGFLHAISAVLLCILSRRLTGSSLVALVTGILWALYPPAVIGAGKFLSETLAVVLVLGILLALSQSVSTTRAGSTRSTVITGLSVGLLTGCLMLTKPALTYSVVVINALALWSFKSNRLRVPSAAAMLIGTIIPILPWAAFTEITTGHMSVMNERMPTFNVVNGLDLETDGGGCISKAPFALMFPENADTLPSALGLFLANPERTVNLVLRKVPRLVAVPWDDFRMKFYSVGLVAQQYWHQLLMLLGTCGLLAFLATVEFGQTEKDPSEKRAAATFIGLASTAMILGHFVYLIVITTPRYEFTAVPFLILFGGYAIGRIYKYPLPALLLASTLCLIQLLLQRDLVPFFASLSDSTSGIRIGAGMIKAVLLSMGLAIIYFLVRKSTPNHQITTAGKWSFALAGIFGAAVILAFAINDSGIVDWSCRLQPGVTIHREVQAQFPASQKPDSAIVIFDGDIGGSDASVIVNGHPAAGKPESLFLYSGNKADRETLQLFSNLMRLPAAQLRQWRAVPVPLTSINLQGQNDLTLKSSNETSVTVYGSYPPADGTRMKIPSLNAARFLSSAEKIEGRLPDPRTVESTGSKSSYESSSGTQTDDLSPAPGRQFGQYHIFLIIASGQKTVIY